MPKGKSSAKLFLDLIDKFDSFREEFISNIEAVSKKIDKHEEIINGPDGRSGISQEVAELKIIHKSCNIADLNNKFNIGIGILVTLQVVGVIVLTIVFDNKFRHSEQTSNTGAAYAQDYNPNSGCKTK